jgi:hypothetical protein
LRRALAAVLLLSACPERRQCLTAVDAREVEREVARVERRLQEHEDQLRTLSEAALDCRIGVVRRRRGDGRNP